MRDHVTLDDLRAFRSGEMTGDQIFAIASHLRSCDECSRLSVSRYAREAARSIDAAIVDAGDHIDSDRELFAFVAGTLPAGARARIIDHLHACAVCREDVDDLNAVPDRRFHMPRWAAAAAVLATLVAGGTLFIARRSVTDAHPRRSVETRRTSPTLLPTKPSATRGYGREDWDNAVQSALASGRLPIPDRLRALRPAPDVLRDAGAASLGMFSPAGEVIETQRPEFTWPATPGATYVVTVAWGNESRISSETLPTARWRTERNLPRGQIFTWAVEVQRQGQATVILPAPPQPPSLFLILGERGVAELTEARTRFPDDHLLLGVLYARHGLRDRALEELEFHSRLHMSPIAARLAASIRSWW